MGHNMVCISGDKGGAAQLLGLPTILFDDKEENLVDVVNKGTAQNVGVLVRRGDAQSRRVRPRNRHLVVNDPHDWVWWCWQFARMFPQPADPPMLPQNHSEFDTHTRSQPFRVNNQTPTQDIFRYQRGRYSEYLMEMREQERSSSRLAIAPERFCSSPLAALSVPSPTSPPALPICPSILTTTSTFTMAPKANTTRSAKV